MMERLSSRHVVLLGIGHTNAHIVRMWRMNAIPDTDLTCISDNTIATYSGMMPAVLAGQIPREQMEIDLVRLCASVGARLLTDRVTGIDPSAQRLLFDTRPPVPFDVLSIGIGSTADRRDVHVQGESLVEVKPMQSFLDRLRLAVEKAIVRVNGRDLQVCVVGGGVASVEISTCLPAYLNTLTDHPYAVSLLTGGKQILPSVGDSMRGKVHQELQNRGVKILTEAKVKQVTEAELTLGDGKVVSADLVIWVTNAIAPPLLGKLELDLDRRGFIETDSTLSATSARNVFAVGDTGTIVGESLPKAGVYAVRQGPVLWENIQRTLDRRPLQEYQPQRSFLKLINLGDGRAVGQWRRFSFSGEWAMRWKHRIDSRFMDLFEVQGMNDTEEPMQCRGCGCKLGIESLDAGLDALAWDGPEDAAVVGGDDSKIVASTDFFASPVDDPYLAGRIAAVHSASDIVASGAQPTDALANVVVCEGDPKSQQQVLHDFMSGANDEFESMGATIVGGHTIVGPRMEAGFTVLGETIGQQPIRKGNLKVGDRLFLTKPLGIGVLLAAQMRSMCRADWYQALIETMLLPQQHYASIASELGITAGTDVTGFGLAGHLIEMLEASHLSADLFLNRIPVLPGVASLIEAGVESSLAPENRRVSHKILADHEDRSQARYKVLFDPQTCGGLLLAASQDAANRLQHAAVAGKLTPPVEIGRVIAREEERNVVILVRESGTAAEPTPYAATRD